MLTIRLTRKGKKNQPFFRVVVIDKKRSSTGGRAVEDLGYKNPLTKKVSLKKERILYWIKNGAKPSATIHNLLVTEKILDAKKIVKKSKKPVASAAPATPVTPAAAAAPVTAAPVEAPKEEVKPVAAMPEGQASLAPEGAGSTPAPVEPQKDLPAPTEEPKPAA
jgi:small subunit ribosomal protein S16